MSDVDVNACALESLMSQLLHAQGFKSISLTVAPKSSMGSSTFSKKLTSYRVLTPFHFLLACLTGNLLMQIIPRNRHGAIGRVSILTWALANDSTGYLREILGEV